MKNKIIIIVAIIAVLALSGCQGADTSEQTDGGGQNTPPINSVPDISGEVLDITNDNVLRVLVDSKAESISGRIWVTVSEETKFVDSSGNIFEPEDVSSVFEIGKTASFLSNGMIMESDPMQTNALYAYLEQ